MQAAADKTPWIAVNHAEIGAWFRDNIADMQKKNPRKWHETLAQKQFRYQAGILGRMIVPDVDMPMPDRGFAVEIEGFLLGRNLSLSYGYAPWHYLNKVLNMVGGKDWKIKTDATIALPFNPHPEPLAANGKSFEIVPPILKGEAGLAEYVRIATALYNAGFRANGTCGLHLHVDARNTTLREKKNLVKAYQNNVDTYESYLSEDRKKYSIFCKRNNFIPDDELELIENEAALTERFCDVLPERSPVLMQQNFHALKKHGTVEWKAKEGNAFPMASGYIRQMVCFTDAALSNPNAHLPTLAELRAMPPHPAGPMPKPKARFSLAA